MVRSGLVDCRVAEPLADLCASGSRRVQYNDALSSAEPQLSIVAARLERLRTRRPSWLSCAAKWTRSASRAKSSPSRPTREASGTSCAGDCDRRAAPYVITVDPDFSGRMTFLADLWARRHDAEVIVASRYVDGSRVDMPARAPRRQPRAERRLPPRPESRRERWIERHPPVPDRCRQRAAARGDRLRHPAGSAGARLRRRVARARDSAALHAEPGGGVEGARGARVGVSAHVLDALEAAQFDRGGRLRLPRARQPDPAAALLAATAATDTSSS